MARWFWYLSSKKIDSLRQPVRGWGLLRQRVRTADLEAGVPWAKISTHVAPTPNAIESVEKLEREIYRNHTVPAVNEIFPNGPLPLFCRFEGYAGRIILRESYKDEEGECVFLMAGVQGTTGVLLLGSGANVFGSASANPRQVNPSIDPVGSLLVLLERKGIYFSYTRAGIARDAQGLSPQECISYSLGAALQEIQETSFTYRVRALAITSAVTQFYQIRLPQTLPELKIDHVIVGSPIYVEQLDADT
jgi:hypothetical protein